MASVPLSVRTQNSEAAHYAEEVGVPVLASSDRELPSSLQNAFIRQMVMSKPSPDAEAEIN
jgi:hypothetical protein